MEPTPRAAVRAGISPQQHGMSHTRVEQAHVGAGSVRPHSMATHVYEGMCYLYQYTIDDPKNILLTFTYAISRTNHNF